MKLGAQYVGEVPLSIEDNVLYPEDTVIFPLDTVRDLLLGRDDFEAVYIEDIEDCREVELWV
jgi:hypothetical protein